MKAIYEQRLAKLKEIAEGGANPFPYRFDVSHRAGAIRQDFDRLSGDETAVSIAGRLMSLRPHGKTAFGHIRDASGDIQVYFRKDTVGEERFKFLDLMDIGDLVGVSGTVFKTRTGEITVKASSYALLTKSLRPLPEKWHGLRDKETRYRQRYVDLFANLEVRDVFVKRSAIISHMRRLLDARGFVEVETPVLQPLYGGAAAEPFITHHNALDMKLYLRIADELYLKRLLVGGLEKVYEISKDFRNEGIDRTHSPEFTQLELYQAYADYIDMMNIVEEMVESLAIEICGSTRITYQGRELDFKRPWKRLSVAEGLKIHAGVDLDMDGDQVLRAACERTGDGEWTQASRGEMIESLIDQFVEPELIEPTFLYDYPVEISPLAKVSRKDERFAERFEPFVCGFEIGNAFSEQNDPIRQREVFERQREGGENGDIDLDFIRALEYGMPPAGGLGIGVDRLVMLLTDSHSIRDVLLFPPMRHEADIEDPERDEPAAGADGFEGSADGVSGVEGGSVGI
jgi:lysyl-tRNA synthetase class 2